MRWAAPDTGESRIKSGFLFFPRCISREIRWLEFAVWEQYHDGINWVDHKWY